MVPLFFECVRAGFPKRDATALPWRSSGTKTCRVSLSRDKSLLLLLSLWTQTRSIFRRLSCSGWRTSRESWLQRFRSTEMNKRVVSNKKGEKADCLSCCVYSQHPNAAASENICSILGCKENFSSLSVLRCWLGIWSVLLTWSFYYDPWPLMRQTTFCEQNWDCSSFIAVYFSYKIKCQTGIWPCLIFCTFCQLTLCLY